MSHMNESCQVWTRHMHMNESWHTYVDRLTVSCLTDIQQISVCTQHTHAHTHTPTHAHAHIHPRRRASVVSRICVNMNELCHTCVKQLSHDYRKSSKLNSALPCERLVNKTSHTYVYQGNVMSHIMSHTCEAAEWWHTNIRQSDSLMSGFKHMFIWSSCVTRHVIRAHILSLSGASQSWHIKFQQTWLCTAMGATRAQLEKIKLTTKNRETGEAVRGDNSWTKIHMELLHTFTPKVTRVRGPPHPLPPSKSEMSRSWVLENCRRVNFVWSLLVGKTQSASGIYHIVSFWNCIKPWNLAWPVRVDLKACHIVSGSIHFSVYTCSSQQY